jgi:hypothetical protein
MESGPGDTVRRDGVLSRGKARARGPVSVPLLILGLAQLAIFALMAVLASTSAYFPFDVPVERWIQELLGGTAPWLFSAVTALNGARQTLVGFLLLLIVVILNPRAIVFAVLASLTGPIYFFVNSTISRPRPSGQLVELGVCICKCCKCRSEYPGSTCMKMLEVLRQPPHISRVPVARLRCSSAPPSRVYVRWWLSIRCPASTKD